MFWHNLTLCKQVPLSLVGDESDEIQTDEEPGDYEKSDNNVEEEGWDDLSLARMTTVQILMLKCGNLDNTHV